MDNVRTFISKDLFADHVFELKCIRLDFWTCFFFLKRVGITPSRQLTIYRVDTEIIWKYSHHSSSSIGSRHAQLYCIDNCHLHMFSLFILSTLVGQRHAPAFSTFSHCFRSKSWIGLRLYPDIFRQLSRGHRRRGRRKVIKMLCGRDFD